MGPAGAKKGGRWKRGGGNGQEKGFRKFCAGTARGSNLAAGLKVNLQGAFCVVQREGVNEDKGKNSGGEKGSPENSTGQKIAEGKGSDPV